jgi:hypothetical protein
MGGLLGFLSAVGKDFILEKSKNKLRTKDFKRQKLEEIFILINIVSQETGKPLKYQGSLDGVGAKIGMLVRFYFPHLNNDYNEFIKVFKQTSLRTLELNEGEPLSTDVMANYYKAHKLFINKVVTESKKYV